MRKLIITISFLFLGLFVFSQKDINNYKYIIVPMRYDFLNSGNQYRLNTLTRHLFKQEGFVTLFEKEQFPNDLMQDRCKALYVDVKKAKGGFLTTRLEIFLNDCIGKEVYKSEYGSSREKDYKMAYSEALRDAFESIEQLKYKYQPIEINTEKNKKEAVQIQDVEAIEKEIEVVETEDSIKQGDVNSEDATLYAQEKQYGYQLVDSDPKVVMKLLSTSAQNVFIVKDKNAIVYKENGYWYYSENNGELNKPRVLNIKF